MTEWWVDIFLDSWIHSEGLTNGLSKVSVFVSQEGASGGVSYGGFDSEGLTDRKSEGWVDSLLVDWNDSLIVGWFDSV